MSNVRILKIIIKEIEGVYFEKYRESREEANEMIGDL